MSFKNWVQGQIDIGTATGANLLGAATGANQRNIQEQQRQAAETAYEREVASAREAMEFSANEAQKNRDYQTEMSNTAYQRATADLKAAGLNPILAAGTPSSSPGGSTAQGFSASAKKADVSERNQIFDLMNSVSRLVSSAASVVRAAN